MGSLPGSLRTSAVTVGSPWKQRTARPAHRVRDPGLPQRTLGEIRTPDTRIRNPVLYPLSYKGMYCDEPAHTPGSVPNPGESRGGRRPSEPPRSPGALVRSYRTVSPLSAGHGPTGGLLSVALSRGSHRVAVNNHPALWSRTFLGQHGGRPGGRGRLADVLACRRVVSNHRPPPYQDGALAC